MAEPGEVYDDDDPMGFDEGGIAKVLFQRPSQKKWNSISFGSRRSPGKRKRNMPAAKCAHAGCYQFTRSEDGRCLVAEINQNAANLDSTWMGHLAAYFLHDGGDEDGQDAGRNFKRFFAILRGSTAT